MKIRNTKSETRNKSEIINQKYETPYFEFCNSDLEFVSDFPAFAGSR